MCEAKHVQSITQLHTLARSIAFKALPITLPAIILCPPLPTDSSASPTL